MNNNKYLAVNSASKRKSAHPMRITNKELGQPTGQHLINQEATDLTKANETVRQPKRKLDESEEEADEDDQHTDEQQKLNDSKECLNNSSKKLKSLPSSASLSPTSTLSNRSISPSINFSNHLMIKDEPLVN